MISTARGIGFKDITGQRFNRLEVVSYSHTDSDRKANWNCICDCGTKCIVSGKQMRTGYTQSCGCLQRNRASEANRVHGGSGTKLHKTWQAMRRRTGNKSQWNYKYYGGRGIRVCEEWKNSFETFKEWAVNNGYKEGLSIERIDVNGNYCPENCTWIPFCEQQGNRRNTLNNAVR